MWSTSLTKSEVRTNASDWEANWRPYIDEIIKLTVPNQISNGGPVIAVQIGSSLLSAVRRRSSKSLCGMSTDNEYSQSPIQRAEYFAQLEATYRANGIVVPL